MGANIYNEQLLDIHWTETLREYVDKLKKYFEYILIILNHT